MDRTGKREVPETGLFFCGTDSGDPAPDSGDAIRFAGDVGRRKCSFSCRHIDPVGEGGKIIVRCFHAVKPRNKGGDRPHICRVAVRIPPGGVHDLHGFVEVVPGIRPRHDHHGMIRHHMTAAAIFVIAVFFIDPVKGPVPIPVLLRPGTDIPVDLRNEAVFRDHADALIQHLLHPQRIIEGGGDHGSDDLCGIDRFAIVGDPGCFGSQFCGKFHVAGGNHAESVDKDLGTDLLGNGLPVHGNTAGGGGMDAVFQAQVSRMFRGETHAAPPENGLFFQQIVQPCIAEKPVGCLGVKSAVLQRADECERAGNIVIRHDERHAHFIGTVMIQNRTELFLDPGFGSALDGSAEVHTGNFAQQSGINFFFVPFPICKHGKILSILIQPDKRTAADWLRSVFCFEGWYQAGSAAATAFGFVVEIVIKTIVKVVIKIIQIAEFVIVTELIVAEFIFVVVIFIFIIAENITGSDEGTAFRTASVLGFHLLFIDLAVAIGANHNHFSVSPCVRFVSFRDYTEK